MKKLKRITAILFAAVLIASVIPVAIFADTAETEPSVTVDGMKVEISNLYDIHDLFISRGTYGAYRPCADNKVVRATSAKLADGHSWSYVLPKPGDYTLCVRYVDGTQKFVHFTAEAAIPVLVADGLDLRITNLTGAKVVRTAKGKYATAGEVKRGENAKGFTPKTFNYADEYTFRFADEGEYTVAVQYENGYTHVEHVTLAKKTPTFTLNEGALTISGLDGLYVIRYAAGEFATIRDIKYTAGSKVIRPAEVSNSSVTVSGLNGVYTFAVQYNDGTVFVKALDIQPDPEPILVTGDPDEYLSEQFGFTLEIKLICNMMPTTDPRMGNRWRMVVTPTATGGNELPEMTMTADISCAAGTAYDLTLAKGIGRDGETVYTANERELASAFYGYIGNGQELLPAQITLTVTIGQTSCALSYSVNVQFLH